MIRTKLDKRGIKSDLPCTACVVHCVRVYCVKQVA